MEAQDLQVLRQLQGWLAAGRHCWLCTVVATTGSSPRPVGSLLACTADGAVAGSLSGGCVEEDLLERLRRGELAGLRPWVEEYGVSPEQNERLGLPCGGRLQVLVEPLANSVELSAALARLVALLAERRCARRELELASGHWRVEEVETIAPLQLDTERLLQCYGPAFQLLLIGAGETSRCVAAMAQLLDYRVLVCDPRRELLAQWTLPGVELLAGMPDDVVRERCRDRHSIVIALTHDPRIDDMALMEALRADLFYVGALGSVRTSAQRRLRLRQLDLSAQQIERLHAPVGLAIGSKRPAEIAVAILAELSALRNGVVPRVHSREAHSRETHSFE